MKAFTARASVFVAPSQYCRHVAEDRGIPPAKLRYIPNGVDTNHFRPATEEERSGARAALGFTTEDVVFCWIGRLDPVKGFDCIPAIWETLTQEEPKARLLIVGDGADSPLVTDLSRRFPGTVVHLPFRDDVRGVYHASDVLLLTSRSEGLSNVLLEGMAAGLPAAVSTAPENLEVGKNGEFLSAFERSDGADIKRVLASWIGIGDRRRVLGREGRARAIATYGLDTTVQQWEDLYSELAADR